VEGKNKMLYVAWDSLVKHVGCKKTAKDIKNDVKKSDWYYYKVCKHAKNQKLFISHGCEFIATQVAHGVVKENAKKWSNLPLCCICCSKDVLC
jgi:exoribonuclease II